jgi:large subunit ribosomal protein L4
VIDGENDKLSRSVRNAPAHKFLEAAGLNVYDLLKYDNVVLTRSALDAVQGRLAK